MKKELSGCACREKREREAADPATSCRSGLPLQYLPVRRPFRSPLVPDAAHRIVGPKLAWTQQPVCGSQIQMQNHRSDG
ncbi:hypothetical protein CSUI_001661 [Cystoisospora suis]|uniref:Uncharacterized protein n=1 Tax=Cystoisospora suis TaxID=483139 RepID=A0A2C6L9M8_9APIC|nr:hypothetical protein CSUI_001661 [Cystoisospora suis]